ncbi:MAG: hypothetical protein KGJ34_00760 [Patescibacteria group bacterium]|nr:hypothetical protein [Patescibacteria group bacterium]
MRKFAKNSFWLPAAGGVLHYLAFPPISFWPLAFISIVPLFIFLWEEKKWWRLLLGAYIYCIIYATLAIIFIFDPILLSTGALLWLIIFGLCLLFCKRFVRSRPWFFALLALALTAGEYFAGNFSFLPAYLIMSGIPLAGTPFQFTALFGGLFSTTLFVALLNGALADVVLSDLEGKRLATLQALSALCILLVLGLSVQVLAPKTTSLPLRVMTIATGDSFAISATKLDIPTTVETPEGRAQLETVIQALLAPIGEAVDREHPDVVVFPEEMIDVRLPGVPFAKAQEQIGVTNSGPLLEEYSAFALVHHVSILATLVTFQTNGKKYISTIEIDKNGNFTGIYNKRLLTIVSEYWPFGHWLPFYWHWELGLLPKATQQEAFIADNPTGPFSNGAMVQPPLSINGVSAGVLICLEGHFPYLYSQWRSQGVHLIIYDGSNVWLPQGRSIYLTFEMHIRELESIYTSLPIVVSGAGENPGLVWPNGKVFYSPQGIPRSSSWSEYTYK